MRLVIGNVGLTGSESLVSSLADGAGDKPGDFSGLFEARWGNKLVGAVWVQLTPGKTAVLWAPGIATGEHDDTGRALMRSALDYLGRHDLIMVQSLVDNRDDVRCAALIEAGFEHLVDLRYLVSLDSSFPKVQPLAPIQFVPSSHVTRERLAEVVEQTYSQTRDCPKLCGVRSMDDVLDGYQETGVFSPERWWIIRHENQDIGCLLLTDHPGCDYLELLYMGVLPGARGNGWGKEIVKFAQWQTRQASRTRLVLAVDAENQPALANYEAHGLLCWERKSVYWRRFSR